MMSYDLKTSIPKPKWYQASKRLSNFFLWCAKKTYKESPEVYAFMMKQTMDMFIYGQAISHINPEKMFGRNKEQK